MYAGIGDDMRDFSCARKEDSLLKKSDLIIPFRDIAANERCPFE